MRALGDARRARAPFWRALLRARFRSLSWHGLRSLALPGNSDETPGPDYLCYFGAHINEHLAAYTLAIP